MRLCILKNGDFRLQLSNSGEIEVRLFNELLLDAPSVLEEEQEPNVPKSIKSLVNPNSLEIIKSCFGEESLKKALPGDRFQFMRQGYFCLDTKLSTYQKFVFNQIVSLKDTWAKMEKSGKSNS